jgi:hypothetical protein
MKSTYNLLRRREIDNDLLLLLVMKKYIGFVIVVLVLSGIYFLTKNSVQQSAIKPTPQPTVAITPTTPVKPTAIVTPSPFVPDVAYCTLQDLQTSLALEPAAGNIFGTITIRNVSTNTCQIVGSNTLSLQYDTQTIKNISVTHKGDVASTLFSLTPNQTLYSKLHYPNGPQCSGPTHTAKVTFMYAVSPTENVDIVNQNGTIEQNIQVCQSESEQTTIDLWYLSTEPIN